MQVTERESSVCVCVYKKSTMCQYKRLSSLHSQREKHFFSFSLSLSLWLHQFVAMEAFDFRAEKRSAMPGNTLFAGIAKTLRILELCLVLLLIWWIFTRLPLALRLSANCLRSPLFVFALSNAIIAALLAQSSRLTAASNSPSPTVEEPELRHNQVADRGETDTCTGKDSRDVTDSESRRVCYYRRSQSEKLEGEGEDKRKMERRELRRSETEKARESKYAHDKLSNEEFRRTIEAFIAKQMRFLREESLAIIVQTSDQTNNI